MTKKTDTVESEESKGVAVNGEGSKGVATVAEAALPAEMGFMDASDFGGNAGFEGADKESFAIPFLQLLQKMSPKVDEDHAEYIEGAKAGMLYNNVTGQLYDGKEGILVVPCAYSRMFIQWGGREGEPGFKAQYTVEEFAALAKDETKAKQLDGRWYVPNEDGSIKEKVNDRFEDTRCHYVIVIDKNGEYGSAIMSLASSQIKSSKKLMTSLQQKKVKFGDKMVTPPTFANLVRVKTSGRSNEQGSWSGLDFELEGMVTDKGIYAAGKDFYKTIVSGEAKADFAKADAASAAGDTSGPQTAEAF